MIRTFIAVRIPESPPLGRLQARLSSLGDRFRPVAVSNLHVTLKFLGDTDEDQVAEISAAVKRVAAAHLVAEARLVGLGAFPTARRPSAVWIGLEHAEVLGRIAAELDRALEPLGFRQENRPFQPHLTVLRVRSRPPQELFTILSEMSSTDFGPAPIHTVELFQSELQKGGSKYTILSSAPLGRE